MAQPQAQLLAGQAWEAIRTDVLTTLGLPADPDALLAEHAQTLEDYEQTVGWMIRYRGSSDGKQPGDPARAAKVITDLVRLDDPPLRLLLGSDAGELAEKASKARAAEAEKWAAVSRSTDFPTGT